VNLLSNPRRQGSAKSPVVKSDRFLYSPPYVASLPSLAEDEEEETSGEAGDDLLEQLGKN
jgi:hypothetical protein